MTGMTDMNGRIDRDHPDITGILTINLSKHNSIEITTMDHQIARSTLKKKSNELEKRSINLVLKVYYVKLLPVLMICFLS